MHLEALLDLLDLGTAGPAAAGRRARWPPGRLGRRLGNRVLRHLRDWRLGPRLLRGLSGGRRGRGRSLREERLARTVAPARTLGVPAERGVPPGSDGLEARPSPPTSWAAGTTRRPPTSPSVITTIWGSALGRRMSVPERACRTASARRRRRTARDGEVAASSARRARGSPEGGQTRGTRASRAAFRRWHVG
ncbi:hypothetical protein NKG05_09440 [Oerskovia sp. M15]